MTCAFNDGSDDGAKLGERWPRFRAGSCWGSHGARAFPVVFRRCSGARRRPRPIPEGWGPIPPSLLRNSDEQTIAGLCAVFTAIESKQWPRDRYEGWGVVAASRFLGRANLAAGVQSFLAEGVWGTSPHLIPHFALHSASGTISLGLGLHGPNLGVGGGLHAAAEGFLAALTWLSSGNVPGVWLVLSGWSPELVPDRNGGPPRRVIARRWRSRSADRAFQTAGSSSRRSSVVNLATQPRRLTSSSWRRSLQSAPPGTGPRTVATDPMGRLRIELIEEPNGSG